VSAIREQGGRAEFAPTVDEIVDALASSLAPGDRVVVLSNGGFGGLHDRLLAALRAAAAR
jgi:UDP-N-acetylmuramate: L-alanyl-gamma-D-glutamyl-meso-diaminopimelate ligase